VEVQIRTDGGCIYVVGSVFSLGLLPFLKGRHRRQLPARMDDAGITLRDGRHVAWGAITQVRGTDQYLQRRYIRTVYVITHAGGKLTLATDELSGFAEVLGFIGSHLPPGVALARRA
jgi:hypothetical protein